MIKLYSLVICVCLALNSKAQSLYFPPIEGSEWETLSPESLDWCPNKIDSLYAYLDTNNTKAFILLIDGKIVLEKYFDGHTESSPWQWASAGKTITSFLVGVAQQENYLNINDVSSDYLGEGWTNCTPEQEANITIWNQLTMTSGLDDGVADPYCTLSSCLEFAADAGTRWAYHNGPYTLLDGVIENATGSTLNAYTTEKLKNPIGMTGAFIPVDYNNVYFSNARSMARFGLLILNNGNWDGNQLMTDEQYFSDMVNTSQSLNESYGYLWWLNGKPSYMVPGTQFVFNGPLSPNAPQDMFAAMGKDGQFINVVPSENMVWIRMGNAPEDLPVPFLLNDGIWEYINDLLCVTHIAEEADVEISTVQVYPNPANESISVKSSSVMVNIDILNQLGRVVRSVKANSTSVLLSVDDLSSGTYLVRITDQIGNLQTINLIVD